MKTQPTPLTTQPTQLKTQPTQLTTQPTQLKTQPLSRDFMLARATARDAAFDGVFLTCVRTTGIYCLPSCRARTPKPTNVEHAPTPQEARARGFRPCKRCRPDDRYTGRDPDREALFAALAAVRAGSGPSADVASFAAAAGCGATKLLLLCRRHLHRAPADVLLLARLERARELLATTRARVLDVALDSGFPGSSAFHQNFRARFGVSPRAYRDLLGASGFALRLPPGHPTAACLLHQARDPASVSERNDGRTLHTALAGDGRALVLSLEHRGGTVSARVQAQDGKAPGAAMMAAAHAAAARMLRLDCDPAAGERALARDPALRPLLRRGRGLRPWLMADAFDCLTFAILGQQVHVGFARQLRRDLARRCGAPVGDLRAPPVASAVAALDVADLQRMHTSRAKAEAVLAAARAVASGDLDLEALAAGSAEVAAARLQDQRGIGPWTAQYVLLRGLGFLDCVPIGDSALATAAERVWSLPARPEGSDLARRCAPFAPHRSLLTFYLWRSFADAAAGSAAIRTMRAPTRSTTSVPSANASRRSG